MPRIGTITSGVNTSQISGSLVVGGIAFPTSKTAKVNANTGDDGSGSIGGTAFATIGAANTAVLAAMALSANTNTTYLIHVNEGVYNEYNITHPDIVYLFDEWAIVHYLNQNIVTDFTNGAGKYRIYGHGQFFRTNQPQGGVQFYWPTSDVIVEGAKTSGINFPNDKGGFSRDGGGAIIRNFEIWGRAGTQDRNHGGTLFENCVMKAPIHHAYSGQGSKLAYKKCEFEIDPLWSNNTGTTYTYSQDITDKNGTLIAEQKIWNEYLVPHVYDTSALTQQEAIDQLAATIASNYRVTTAFTLDTTSETGGDRRIRETMLIEDCVFRIKGDKLGAIRIRQNVNNVNTYLTFKNVVIEDQSTGQDGWGIALLQDGGGGFTPIDVSVTNLAYESGLSPVYATSTTNSIIQTVEQRRETVVSASAPTTNDDETLGYLNGKNWVETTTGTTYTLIDQSGTAAVWNQTS